ncbi:MAG: gamma-glutamylcyclotransferase [Acidobacteria bacterium]|nr:gamma-glutamylcyclotransferase [Acidobacteriota bacterium]
MSKKYKLAVNGTLMRGLSLNKNLLDVGATFLYETKTTEHYRLWSIGNKYPGMLKTAPSTTGNPITVEVWELDAEGFLSVLEGEPPGLTVGRVELKDGTTAFGVLAEPWLVEGQREITDFGGWREYISSGR